jgi:hypothetical protein
LPGAEHADRVQPLLDQLRPATDRQIGGAQAEGMTVAMACASSGEPEDRRRGLRES